MNKIASNEIQTHDCWRDSHPDPLIEHHKLYKKLLELERA